MRWLLRTFSLPVIMMIIGVGGIFGEAVFDHGRQPAYLTAFGSLATLGGTVFMVQKSGEKTDDAVVGKLEHKVEELEKHVHLKEGTK